jgi:hypothetical protein
MVWRDILSVDFSLTIAALLLHSDQRDRQGEGK